MPQPGSSDDAPHDSDDCDAVFIDIDNIIYNDNPQKPWDPSRPPATLDLTKPLPNEELYPDGKRYAGQGLVQFTAFQRECLRGNRLFNSRPRTKAQQVTYLLSVYKNMTVDMIHVAISMQPDAMIPFGASNLRGVQKSTTFWPTEACSSERTTYRGVSSPYARVRLSSSRQFHRPDSPFAILTTLPTTLPMISTTLTTLPVILSKILVRIHPGYLTTFAC
jgi:hypothetical protein